jgi:predicted secreted protein
MRTPTSRRILVAAVAALLVALVGLAGCGGDDSSSKGGSSDGSSGSSATVYGPGDSISVAKGQTFVIELESNPTTGYEWTAEADTNAEFVKSSMVTHSTLAGAPGMQRLTFEATKTGSSTLVLNYARSFEPDNPPAQTESFPLKVS